jgi:cilia- and flagella-associated protein 298
MMAYPMGLPAWDPVALCITGDDGLDGTQVGSICGNFAFIDSFGNRLSNQAAAELLEPSEAQLWVASKDFPRDQRVGDRLGWNEKTKV